MSSDPQSELAIFELAVTTLPAVAGLSGRLTMGIVWFACIGVVVVLDRRRARRAPPARARERR